MKQKTVKTAAKRVKITGSGKLQRRNLSAQHLTVGKSKRTLRNRDKLQDLAVADRGRIKKLVPYK